MLHGSDCLSHIHTTVRSLFARGNAYPSASAASNAGGDGHDDDDDGGAMMEQQLSSLPVLELSPEEMSQLGAGELRLVDVMVSSGVAATRNEARRLIRGGGVKLHDVRVADEMHKLDAKEFASGRCLKLSVGKKKNLLLKMP